MGWGMWPYVHTCNQYNFRCSCTNFREPTSGEEYGHYNFSVILRLLSKLFFYQHCYLLCLKRLVKSLNLNFSLSRCPPISFVLVKFALLLYFHKMLLMLLFPQIVYGNRFYNSNLIIMILYNTKSFSQLNIYYELDSYLSFQIFFTIFLVFHVINPNIITSQKTNKHTKTKQKTKKETNNKQKRTNKQNKTKQTAEMSECAKRIQWAVASL